MKTSDCLNNVIICSSHKVISIPGFFVKNKFPKEQEAKALERASRVQVETKFLETNYPDVYSLIGSLFQKFNEEFIPLNIRGLRNLIGYPAFWLKKYEYDKDQHLGFLIKLCLGHSFMKSGTASDHVSETPSADQKTQIESITVTTSEHQPEMPMAALTKVTYSMNHVYELLTNLKNSSLDKPLVGKKRLLDPSTLLYNRRYQDAFSKLVTHSYPNKSGIKPRDEKLWAWVRAGVEIMFPIPSDHQEHHVDLYQSLYACQTNLVILNAIADDIADNFRDQVFLDQILSVFPTHLSNSYFIQQDMGGEEPIELNSKQSVEDYLRGFVFKDTSIIEQKIRDRLSHSFKEKWQSDNENRRLVLSQLLETKAEAVSDADDLERPSQEKIDRYIPDQVIFEIDRYISDKVGLGVKNEVDSKVQYILLAWEIFTDSFKGFEKLIQDSFKRIETSDLQDLKSIREIIIDAYKQIFHNFKISAQLNCDTTEGNIIIASKVASHNMNIMAFHQMCAVLSLSLEGVNAIKIANFIDDEKVKQLFMAEQYLGRYSNILATGVPTQKINSDGTAEIKLSREFKLGDITGTPEIMEYLCDSVRPVTIRRNFSEILTRLIDNDSPHSRDEAIGRFSTLLIDVDGQKIITDKFVHKFKKYQQLLREHPLKRTDEFKIVFNSFNGEDGPNPQIVFLLFYLMFKGEI